MNYLSMNKFCKVLTLLVLLASTNIHSARADGEQGSWLWWGTKRIVIVGSGVAAIVAARLVLSAAGFTAGGVAAGSVAAAVQVFMGGVIVPGSFFAGLQSAGVAGIGLGTKTVLFAVGSWMGYKTMSAVEEVGKQK